MTGAEVAQACQTAVKYMTRVHNALYAISFRVRKPEYKPLALEAGFYCPSYALVIEGPSKVLDHDVKVACKLRRIPPASRQQLTLHVCANMWMSPLLASSGRNQKDLKGSSDSTCEMSAAETA